MIRKNLGQIRGFAGKPPRAIPLLPNNLNIKAVRNFICYRNTNQKMIRKNRPTNWAVFIFSLLSQKQRFCLKKQGLVFSGIVELTR